MNQDKGRWGGAREGAGRKRVIPHIEGHCYCSDCRAERRKINPSRDGINGQKIAKRAVVSRAPVEVKHELTENEKALKRMLQPEEFRKLMEQKHG